LEHGLHQLVLHGQKLFHLWVVVVGIVVLTVAVVVPRVHHLRNVWRRDVIILEWNRTPKLYDVIFIYLYLSDEVVDKVPKQSHNSHQSLTSMQPNIHTT
jgi:hypothetical protein